MTENHRLVVAIGGANGERLLQVAPEQFRLGSKHSLAPQQIMPGGSSVNHACRLLSMGVPVFPIMPVAQDSTGEIIAAALRASASVGGGELVLDGFYMEGEQLSTSFTTIFTIGAQRSIFNEFSDNLIKTFPDHCENQLQKLWTTDNRSQLKPGAVMIGHLHADRRDPPGQGGGITERIIRSFAEQKVAIFTNLGSSQYRLGIHRWQHLLDKLACFQLDIDEIRIFGEAQGLNSLEETLDWFQDKCTVIITMERMGAVARLKGSEQVVLAWPYDLNAAEIVDSTGAGDAFAAGVVESSLEVPLQNDASLCRALANGRLWGAYACTTLGGAGRCPSRSDLADFKAGHRLFLETESKSMDEARPLLRILDRMFLRD